MEDRAEPHPANRGLSSDAYWYLVGFVDKNQKQWRTIIRSLPLKIGRHSGADLYLYSTSVSHEHAELFEQDGALWVRDLTSTNGTYVNSTRIEEAVQLNDGDTIHFADLVFRLGAYRPPLDTDEGQTRELDTQVLAAQLREHTSEFTRLMNREAVQPYFQAMYNIAGTQDVLGYELLSRGLLGDLETLPLELFYIAERLGRERELSQLCRKVGARAARSLPGSPICFMNTHPAELQEPKRFLRSVEELRDEEPGLRLAIEIHEAAVTGSERIAEIRDGLRDLGVQLAYDDFGTGQSRLRQIAEVPPDYLKFDMSLIRDLHRAPEERLQFVAGLVATSRSIGIVPIAEGIESRGEAEACASAGFECAQGYYYSLPRPVGEEAVGDERPVSPAR
ncbi:MAG: EAL domain-containing protein [bacterium]|nr:EAL domain-containing protein [bacterium]